MQILVISNNASLIYNNLGKSIFDILNYKIISSIMVSLLN